MEKNENRKQIMNLVMLAGVSLFISSYWVEDNQTAVNRRYAGMLTFGIGLAFK